MPDRFIGHLETVITHGIRGWVIDTQNLRSELMVEVKIGNRLYKTPVNLHRRNLWRGTEGPHGFEIKLLDLPPSLFDEPISQISARLAGHDYTLANSPITFNRKTVAIALTTLIQKDIQNIDTRFPPG